MHAITRWLALLGVALAMLSAVQGGQIIADEPVDYPIGTATGYGCSLRGAILNANADSVVDPLCAAGDGTDTIIMQSNFTILLDGRGENNGALGDLDIHGPIILQGDGHTIDGASRDRLFDIIGFDDFPVRMENITLTGGRDNGFPGDLLMAGAIRSRRTLGLLSLSHVHVVDNQVDLSSKFEFIQASGGIWVETLYADFITFAGNSIRGNIPPDSQVAAAIALSDDQSTMMHAVIESNWIEQTNNFHAGVTATGGIGVFGSAALQFSGVARSNQGKTGGFMFVDEGTDAVQVEATDHLEENTADTGGLIDLRGGSPITLSMNGFSIRHNQARLGGALYGQQGRFVVEDFDQITNNLAEGGGAIYGDANDCILLNGRQITMNNATRGGAIWLENAFLLVRNVQEISNNTAALEGGVLYASGTQEGRGVLFQNVQSIRSNSVTGEDGVGGAVSAYYVNVTLSNITTIADHYAAKGGVVALQSTAGSTNSFRVTLETIGSLSGHTADFDGPAGAVIYTQYADALITGVTGDITNNRAENGDGGLIYTAHGRAELTNSSATVTKQFAFRGGMIAVEGSGYGGISGYDGDILHNDGFFEGGLLFCAGSATCEIHGFSGRIEDNECGSGCLIYSEGQAILTDITGDIVNNEANAHGGVVYAVDARVENIHGTITDNSAETGSGGVFYVTNTLSVHSVRSIDGNRAYSQGGVAYSEGSITMDSVCQISNNLVEKGNGSVAWAQGQLTVSLSRLENNPSPALLSASATVQYEESNVLRASASITGTTGLAYIAQVFPEGGAGNYSYLWTTGETTAVARNIQDVVNQVTVTDGSLCSATVTVTIPPPQANAGPDQTVCPSDPITVGGSPPGTPGPGIANAPLQYQWQPESLVLGNDEQGNTQVLLLSDQANFTLTVTDPITGLSATDSALIRSYPVDVDVTSPLQICQGKSVILGGSPTASAQSGLSLVYVWSPSAGLNDPTSSNPVAHPEASINYTLTVSSRECRGLKKESFVYVEVLPASSVLAVAPPPGESAFSLQVCPGDSVTLGGDMEDNEDSVMYVWSPTSGLDDPASPHPVATPRQTTTYTLKVFSAGNCSSATSSVTVNVNTLSVDPGQDLLTGGRLGGSPTARGGQAPYIYQWSPATSLSNAQTANPMATPSASLAYRVTATDASGCQVQSEAVNVIVRNPSTAGYVALEFSDDQTLTPLQAQAEVLDAVVQALAIPRLAVELSRLDALDDNTFDAGLRITSVDGKTGEQLAGEFILLFDCDPDFLPCTVDESESMSLVGWKYLQFVNPPSYFRSDTYSQIDSNSLPVPAPQPSPQVPVIQPPQSIPSTFPEDDEGEVVIVLPNTAASLGMTSCLSILFA